MFKRVFLLTVLILTIIINPGGAEEMKYTNPYESDLCSEDE